MAAADTMFESLQRLQSMMESFDESLSQLCKDNSSESALELWKILLKYYYDLQKALQSRYETLNIKEEKPEEPETRGKSKENETLKVNGLNPASSSFSKVLLSVEVRPEIKALCDKADGRGLKNYIVDNMNEGETLRNELLVALSKAPDAAKLVIKALEDCDLSKNDYSEKKMGEPSVSSVDGEACRLLLESLYPVFGNDNGHIVPPDVKYSAQVIAKEWGIKILGRSKKMRKDVSSANKSDLHVFLQLVATFRLAAGYCRSRLCTYFSAIIPGKRTPELCRSLGLSSKIPTLGKRDPALALRCAHVAGLMDKIDPVNLLTSYLSREENRAKALLTKGHGSAVSQDAANLKMVHALENVIILSKEYGLRSHFCEDDLQKKLTILVQEKETLIKKRIEDPQAKKVKLLRSYLGREQCRARDILTNGLGSAVSQDAANLKMVHALKNVIKLSKEYGLQSHFCEDDLQEKLTILVQEKETLIKKRIEDAQEKKVNLLRSYLGREQCRAKDILTNGLGSAVSQDAANLKMVHALENVIKLIKEYGLQSHFCEDDLQKKLTILVQEKETLIEKRNEDAQVKKDTEKDAKEKAQEEIDRKKAAEKKAQEEEDRKKAVEKKAQEEENRKKATEKKAQEGIDRKKAVEKKAHEEEDRKKATEKKAQEKEDRKKATEKKAQEEIDRKKAAEKKAQEEEDRKKAVEKKAQEEENRKKATEKKAQEGIDRKKAVEKKAHEEEDRKKATEKKAQEKEDREKATEKKAQEEKDRKNAAEKKAQEKEDREKAAEKKAKETEDRKKAAENSLQHKRRQSFEPGFGPSERENYASKRAKHASPNVTTRVAGGMGNSKASHYNINGVQKNSGLIGHDHHTSPFSAANRSSTGAAAGGFTSTPSIAAAQINDERRRLPSAFGTSNLTPIGSSFYGSSAPAGAFAVPLYNVAEINYEGRGQQCYTMNLGEVDKNHVRASVYGTGDLAKSSATQSNYNYEGRSQQSYKLNFVEVDNIPVSTSTYGTGVLANSSATQAHYERRGPEMYTSAFGGGNKANIGSSVYGSNSRTIPLSDVNQGGHERSLGQYLGFASRNMVPIESSGYGPDVSRVPSSNVTQGHFESKIAVIDKYRFNSGSSLL